MAIEKVNSQLIDENNTQRNSTQEPEDLQQNDNDAETSRYNFFNWIKSSCNCYNQSKCQSISERWEKHKIHCKGSIKERAERDEEKCDIGTYAAYNRSEIDESTQVYQKVKNNRMQTHDKKTEAIRIVGLNDTVNQSVQINSEVLRNEATVEVPNVKSLQTADERKISWADKSDKSIGSYQISDKFYDGSKYDIISTINSNKDDKNTLNSSNSGVASNELKLSEQLDYLLKLNISSWISKIEKNFKIHINDENTVNHFRYKLKSVLEKSFDKIAIKAKIYEVFHEIPIIFLCENESLQKNRYAEELANKLLCLKFGTLQPSNVTQNSKEYYANFISCNAFENKDNIDEITMQILIDNNIDVDDTALNNIKTTVSEFVNMVKTSNDDKINKALTDIRGVLVSHGVSLEKTEGFIYDLLQTLNVDKLLQKPSSNYLSRQQSTTLIVLTNSNPKSIYIPTPKQKEENLSVMKDEERKYRDNLASVIVEWMKNLPNYNDYDLTFQNTIVNDLAGDITDQMKIDQFMPQSEEDRDKFIQFVIFRWLKKFEVFKDVPELMPHIAELAKQITEIRGKVTDNFWHNMLDERALFDSYVLSSLDVLKNEISIWMNQSSDFFYVTSKDTQNKMIHTLANGLQNKLTKNEEETDIAKEIEQWMNGIAKDKADVKTLSRSLAQKITRLTQDGTIKNDLKTAGKKRTSKSIDNNELINKSSISTDETDTEKLMMAFIEKYIEFNFNIDEPIAKQACGQILLMELKKRNPYTEKELDSISPQDKFTPDRLCKELKYIKLISTWLLYVPVDLRFNIPGNTQRVKFVLNLARKIYEIEVERYETPDAINYDLYLLSVISPDITALPILPEYSKKDVALMVHNLIFLLNNYRDTHPFEELEKKVTDTANPNGIKVIDDFILEHGNDILNDRLALEACCAKLLKETQITFQNDSEANELNKIYGSNELSKDESIKMFCHELEYAREITEWLKNIPLKPANTQEEKELRIFAVTDLAAKIANYNIMYSEESKFESESKNYITKWVSELPLQTEENISVQHSVKQIMNRIKNVNRKKIVKTSSGILKFNKNYRRLKYKESSPDNAIVNAIESWCNGLPLQCASKDKEMKIRDQVMRALLLTVANLNSNQRLKNDVNLFRAKLQDEVYYHLRKLHVHLNKEKYDDNTNLDFIEKIIQAKLNLNSQSTGVQYKNNLYIAIDTIIPELNQRPEFELYKRKLVDKFILDNFYHVNEGAKFKKYVIIIEDALERYFENLKFIDGVSLEHFQFENELYAELFKVPIPDIIFMEGNVNEAKIRCVIDFWLDSLPLRKSYDLIELLKFDDILSSLAKRLNEIDICDSSNERKIQDCIYKCLQNLPLLAGAEYYCDLYIFKLFKTLKFIKEDENKEIDEETDDKECIADCPDFRRYYRMKNAKVHFRTDISNLKNNPIAGPSAELTLNVIERPSCCKIAVPVKTRPSHVLLAIIDNWCKQLPLTTGIKMTESYTNVVKDNLSTTLYRKISKIIKSYSRQTNNLIFNEVLRVEIENIIDNNLVRIDFELKEFLIQELQQSVYDIRYLFIEEQLRVEYKQHLKDATLRVLKEPDYVDEMKTYELYNITDDVVDNFIEYQYNRYDYEGKEFYKDQILKNVNEYLLKILERVGCYFPDSLIYRNKLICELTKIPVPNNYTIIKEIQEIRMKNEINDFFDELTEVEDSNDTKIMKKKLAKRLTELENSNDPNADKKMRKYVSKFMEIVAVEVSPERIEEFVKKLKDSESIRKAPPAMGYMFYK